MCSSSFSLKPKYFPIESSLSPLFAYCLKPTFIIGIFASFLSSVTITVERYQLLHLSIASTRSPFFSYDRHSSGSAFVPKGAILLLSIDTVMGSTYMSLMNLTTTETTLLLESLKTYSTPPLHHMLILKFPSYFRASTISPTLRFERQAFSSGEKCERSFLTSVLPASPPRSCKKWL